MCSNNTAPDGAVPTSSSSNCWVRKIVGWFAATLIRLITQLCFDTASDAKLLAMNLFRTHCSPIAWILYAAILFNSLACSIGHGQMMAAFTGNAVASGSHDGPGMSDMHGGHHAGNQQMYMPMEGSSKKTRQEA